MFEIGFEKTVFFELLKDKREILVELADLESFELNSRI